MNIWLFDVGRRWNIPAGQVSGEAGFHRIKVQGDFIRLFAANSRFRVCYLRFRFLKAKKSTILGVERRIDMKKLLVMSVLVPK